MNKSDNNKEKLFGISTRKSTVNSLLLLFAVCFILYLSKPVISELPKLNIPCLSNFLGFNCPFCGGTRCVSALLNFDIKTAFYYNPMVVIAIVVFLIYVLYCLFSCFGKEFKPPRVNIGNTGIYVIIGIVIIFTIVRNLPFYKDIFY